MKKTIFIILFTLPIVLMIIISIAGRLIVMYIPTPVESVHFANENGEIISEINVGKDKSVSVTLVILPELASNKKVEYTFRTGSSANPECEYTEEDGLITITGLRYGGASKLTAVTDDQKLKAELTIHVTDKDVMGVNLNAYSLSLYASQTFALKATIEPETAVNTQVTWSSSDPSLVEVSHLGVIKAIAPTPDGQPVSITVTTADGGFEAECLVTVVDALPPMAFYRKGALKPVSSSETIVVNTTQIDLADYIRYDENLIEFEEIQFVKLLSGQGVIDGQTVNFTNKNDTIRVEARVYKEGNLVYSCIANFRYSG